MIKKNLPIKFHSLETTRLTDRQRIKQFLAKKVSKSGRTLSSLDFIFSSDQYLLQINKQFLRHDDFTDIITFDLSEKPKQIHGEIYISVERVRENSRIYATSFRHELLRVVFHGVLHLLGFKDKSPVDKKLMRSMEDQWLMEFGEGGRGNSK